MFEKIIINFPTNIGDAIMGLPVLDRLRANYPKSKISVIASNQTKEFLSRNSLIDELLVFDKRWNIKVKVKFTFSLRGKYDLIVDLKHSFLPIFTGTRSTSLHRKFPKNMHAKDTYLALIKRFTDEKKILKSEFIITEEEKNKWESLRISPSLFIACASRALQKRYPYSYLKTVIKDLKKDFSIVILGQEDERDFYKDILTLEGITDLVGKTTIYEVHYLLKQYAKFLLCVDSSILHLGSYLNIPMVAIFGPTDIFRYGPWSDRFKIVRNEALPCVPCQKPHCSLKHKCMDIHPEIVIKAARELLKA